MDRVNIVMEALDLEEEDALKVVEHFTKHDCLDWIDEYKKGNNDEPLTDVHWEDDFEDMINWKFEDAEPFDMLGKSSDIKDYPEMLELENTVIFWYGLV